MTKEKNIFTINEFAKAYKKFIITEKKTILATTASKITDETLVDEFGNFTAEEKEAFRTFEPNKWILTSKLVKEKKTCPQKTKKRK